MQYFLIMNFVTVVLYFSCANLVKNTDTHDLEDVHSTHIGRGAARRALCSPSAPNQPPHAVRRPPGTPPPMVRYLHAAIPTCNAWSMEWKQKPTHATRVSGFHEDIYKVSARLLAVPCWEHIRCKLISSCKLWKLQSKSLDQHPRSIGDWVILQSGSALGLGKSPSHFSAHLPLDFDLMA